MDIREVKVKIKDLVEGFHDGGADGVVGFKGNLDIRPPYQREFVYNEEQQAAVIQSVWRGFPINVMYWADQGDGHFEVMDGQQRTLSICRFVTNKFSVMLDGKPRYFTNLSDDQKDRILDYAHLTVYECSGDESEKLDWFETINVAGEELTAQELLNAVYHGTWLSGAKRYFSRPGAAAAGLAEGYVKGTPIRQDFLELALKWIVARDGLDTIADYMANHQHDEDAEELWGYYNEVIGWAKQTFPNKRKELTGVDWGSLYLAHGAGGRFPNPNELEKRIDDLMGDDEVKNKRGIYWYVLDGDEKNLNLRAFSPAQKRKMFKECGGLCAAGARCKDPKNPDGKKVYELEHMEADHITPWSEGGATDYDNGQMLCKRCNREKSNK